MFASHRPLILTVHVFQFAHVVAADMLRWHMDRVQGRSWHEIKANTGSAQRLRLSHHDAERSCRTDPSKGDAGHPAD